MAKKNSNFISARESRRISRENAKITKKLDAKLNRKHVPETEYLTKMFGDGGESLMMMVSAQMKVALVCNHMPISQVASCITEERILSKLHTLADSLLKDFRIRRPRIAVLALNPHAGDNGLIGKEEEEIIPVESLAKPNSLGSLAP